MTGLDRQNDQIMSICCLVTDSHLNLYDNKGYEAIIQHDKETLEKMDTWCTETHGKTGLTEACLKSTTTATDAATGLLDYIKTYVPQPKTALLAGNSVHADKEFLSRTPYDIAIRHLHYRIFDVSTIKEAMLRWSPEEILKQVPKKKNLHQAREDIIESIEEAKFYRATFFSPERVNLLRPTKD
jgi:oligoribonuclease